MQRVTSRARALRPWLAAAVLPALVALLAMGPRAGALLGAMWAALVLTAGLAATSQRAEEPNTYDPRGRLHG